MSKLREAAIAVIERWDSPYWVGFPATAGYIAALRKALDEPKQEPVAWMDAEGNALSAVARGHLCILQPWNAEKYTRPLYAATVDTTRLETEYTAATLRINNDLLVMAELTAERDAARGEATRLNAGWSKANVDMLAATLERDALQQAAKLALDALTEVQAYTTSPSWSPSMTLECIVAADALKKAGVK